MVKLRRKKPKEPPKKTLYQKMLKRNNTKSRLLPNKKMSVFEAQRRAELLPHPLDSRELKRAKSAILEAETLMDYYKDLIK